VRGILQGPKKSSLFAWVDVKPDEKPRTKTVSKRGGETRTWGDLNLEGIDAAHMDGLGRVTD
jgi:hypothetical protein